MNYTITTTIQSTTQAVQPRVIDADNAEDALLWAAREDGNSVDEVIAADDDCAETACIAAGGTVVYTTHN